VGVLVGGYVVNVARVWSLAPIARELGQCARGYRNFEVGCKRVHVCVPLIVVLLSGLSFVTTRFQLVVRDSYYEKARWPQRAVSNV
jgi:hypothetical protein